MKKPEYTIEQHVKTNVNSAIDSVDEYCGLSGAFDAFQQNTIDSVIVDGYKTEDAITASELFTIEFRKKTGFSK
jgi:hypothetical protein